MIAFTVTIEYRFVGRLIIQVLDGLAAHRDDNSSVEASVRAEVNALCDKFPIYPHGA